MKRAGVALTLLALAACETIGGGVPTDAGATDATPAAPEASKTAASPPPYTCDSFNAAASVGTIDTALITEASGLVVSRRNAGVLWTVNDSGNTERIFAIGDNGKLLGSFILQNATNLDWEDLSVGPAPGFDSDVIYVGDIGDNNRERAEVAVYRVREPEVVPGGNLIDGVVSDVERIALVYPGGARFNAETLFVDRASGDLVIATREIGVTHLFHARADQLHANTTVTLEAAGEIPLAIAGDAARGGSAADTGEAAALRTTYALYLFTFSKGTSLPEALRRPPCALPVGAETRGETVAFAPGAAGYYTLAEGVNNPLYFSARR